MLKLQALPAPYDELHLYHFKIDFMHTSTPKLPHQTTNLFLTDGGLETTLIFLEGIELPYFAAFHLLKEEGGYQRIKKYYQHYLNIARDFKTAFILESPTWRANPDWMAKLDYNGEAMAAINKKAVQMMVELREAYRQNVPAIIISGCIGPRGDGYKAENRMTPEEAEAYHTAQIEVFSQTDVDMATALTMNYVEEAIGITRAAHTFSLPVVISFTVETNGKLPSGTGLQEAIENVDESVVTKPIYYMINCAHPTHFYEELEKGKQQAWVQRIKGIRSNASCKSHAELDESTALDRGNPEELAKANQKLKQTFPHLNVFGGCCGTDTEHIQTMASQFSTAHV